MTYPEIATVMKLSPEVAWANELSVPSPAEIRERVSRFTPEQRAAAEREAIRADTTATQPPPQAGSTQA